jgi:ParB-like chromosome segregation protein Spo0J
VKDLVNIGEHILVSLLDPNPWNPNRMDAFMFEREKASIRTFGFIDPVTVRRAGERYQIIDGEHRVRAAVELGYTTLPCVVLDVTEDEARELTIILNETRGTSDEDRLGEVLRYLAERRPKERLDGLMPFTEARMDQLLERRQIDWNELEKKREQAREKEPDPWVERVYRMPRSSASVLDEAVTRMRSEHDIEQDWQALEMIAADYLSG